MIVKAGGSNPPMSTIGCVKMYTKQKEFWGKTVKALNNIPMDVKITSKISDYYLTREEVVLRSWENIRFQSLIVTPRTIGKPITKAIIYTGGSYQGYKARPQFWMEDALLVMVDPRGQGHSKMDIDSPNHMVQGLPTKEKYRYRGVYCDYRRMIDYLVKERGITKIGMAGTCFGGGMAVGMAALDHRVKCIVADTPWPCGMDDGATQGLKGSKQLTQYLNKNPNERETVKETLRYFDPTELAHMVKAPTLIGYCSGDKVAGFGLMMDMYCNLPNDKSEVLYSREQHGCPPTFALLMRDWFRLWL